VFQRASFIGEGLSSLVVERKLQECLLVPISAQDQGKVSLRMIGP
jgi:hypothetical protein